ncbi:hypothetical protein EB796_009430 [Bugula neritina]|uniref:Uncharacterized protein n=1 Tax=Bugula neritina TaxID=10212 RepID=A0A7J7K0V7_BUGNE|nr:hypothetical protein EB796_009430 [Bugula neritina]
MVTLKRPTKSSAPASNSGGSSSAAKTEDLQRVAKQSSVVEKSTTQKANSGKEDSSKPAHPKQSAWGPTPAAQPASITSQNVEAKVAAPATSTAAAVATSDTSAAAKNGATVSAGNGFNREDRSKVSPAYSDTEKPPVKRYKEGREHGGTAGRYERSNSRGGRSEHHSERGQRRGGARPREFVRGGSASLGRGGPGRSSGVGGRGSRSVSSRGRGGSTREDWEGERAPPKRDTRSSKPEASNGPKESTKPPPSKESQRQQSSLDPNTSSTSTAASGATPTTTAANKPTAPAAVVSRSPTPPVNGVAADSVESATSPQHTDTKEPKGNEPKTGEEQPVGDRSVRRDDRRRGKGRPTKDTYVAPGSRARGGGNSRSQRTSDYYNYSEGYDEAYDSGRYGRGSSRPRASRGRGSYQSSRGNHPAHRGASRTNSRDDAGDKGPKIDQWNGPPEDGGADGHRRLDDAWDKGEQGYSQSYRGRGRGRGSRYSTRGQTTRGRGRHSTLPSSALSPVKRRQDSTNTENDPQEEWETASESSEHLKESGNQSNSRSHKQLEGDDSSQHRGNGANYRGSSRGYRGSGERGRGRGGSRGGGSSRSGHRGSSARDNGKYKEKGSDEKDTSSAASGARGNRTMTNGKAGNSTVYRLDNVSLDSPAAVAAALSNKNSELSDVSKPLSSKDKTANLKGNHSSSTKESVPAVVDPLDGFDLNNYAGVVIIDHMGDPGEESDSWQDEDGFQEVVSRKTRKHRQEQEAAAKAAIEAKAVELLKKERAAASGSRRGHGAQHSAAATSRPRKSKLPPRFLKQHEGKPKTDKFKIEQWDSELMERGAPSRPPQTKSVQEPPLQIGNWDQNMAVSESTVPATTTSTLTSINSRLGVSSASLTSVQSVGLSLDTKPSPSTGDKSSGSEQHDSGIDVSNDKDTGSVRSSPDAGTIVSPQMRSSLIGQPPHSHYPSALSPTQHGSTQHGSSASFTKSPITSRTAAVSNLNPTDSSHKLDFTFDTKQGSGTSAATSEISSAAAPSEVGAEFNMKLDSVKNLWPSAQKTNTNQLFGSNDTPSFQSPPSEVYEQQVELTAAGTTFSSNEGFPAARNDGYSLPPTNQSATNMFVSPGAEASSASAIGTRQPPSPRPPVNQLVSPRVTKSAGNVSGSVISGSASVDSEAPPSQPHSSQSLLTQSTLDGAASVFTPTFQPTYKGSLAPAQSPSATSLSSAILSHQQPSQNYGFMVNPASQQSLVDSSYGSFRSHSVSQHHSVSQPLQPSPALSTQQTNMAPMGLQQTALHQPPYLQSNMSAAVAASTPMIKATTMTLSNNFPSTKVSQFDVSSNQTSMQYLHQFDMPGIMGSQPVSSVTAPPPQSGAFRMPTPPAQNNQITQPHQSPFFSASTQNQNPIGFYAAPSTIQGASQSGFAIGLMSHPTAGAAIVPQGSLVLPSTTSPWPQQPSITPQSLKQFKAAGPTAVGNQMKVQLANHAAVMTSQPPFQMTVGAGSTGQPSNSAGVDYMRMAAQHLQQPSALLLQVGQPPNQQADKSHVTGASQLISASHMGGAKMGGANMMPAGSQLSMQKMLCESVLCYLNVERLRLPNDNNMAAVHPPYYHCCLT